MEDSRAAIGVGPQEAQREIEQASEPYVGRWNRLVSTTNWEKGQIIVEWRAALVAADSSAAEYSDDAWSRHVGGVTGQHVGRLRRVYQRFGQVHEQYPGLYWSHFQAALDWDDAEMWLEGALQNQWSVSQMRRTRWETLGAAADEEPQEAEIVAAELDEDFAPPQEEPAEDQTLTGAYADVQGTAEDELEFGDDEPAAPPPDNAEAGAAIYSDEDERETVRFIRPFENLAELPDDLAEAFEAFKLAILRHKAEGWDQISRDDVLASLDALKELVNAPSAEA